jgi:hypothetical protein
LSKPAFQQAQGNSSIDTRLNSTGNSMVAIRMHMVWILDLTGCQNAQESIHHFLQQADVNQVQPTVEIRGQHCTIRYSVDGPETLTGLRQTLKHMAKGLFSEATQAAIRDLKHRPDEFTVEMLVPPSGWRF